MSVFRIGLLINPLAGIGGPLALKGSDGEAIVAQALQDGAQCLAGQRAQLALEPLAPLQDAIEWLSAPGVMGADCLQQLGYSTTVIGSLLSEKTSATDTLRIAGQLVAANIDLLLFVGGDGTARDIFDAIGPATLSLGIPAGVKMYSGCYAISPQAAARVIEEFIHHKPVSVNQQEVRDIDEEALRSGRINASYYGELLVPNDDRFVQRVKNGGEVDDSAIQAEIAAGIVDDMDNETIYLIGAGTTPKAVLDELGLEGTLLGVDALLGRTLIARDATASELLSLLERHPYHPVNLIITATGNQGHIIGRGNQQLSPELLARVGKDNVKVMITPNKLAQFSKRPLLIDSGNLALDNEWSGWISIIIGYREVAVYPLSSGA